MWPTYPHGPVVPLLSLEDALKKLDTGESTAPVITNEELTTKGVKLHANMVPHVVRGYIRGLDREAFSMESMKGAGGGALGVGKGLSRSDYVDNYFGGEALNVPLRDYLQEGEVNKSRTYWVDCYGSNDAQLTEGGESADWLQSVADSILKEPILPGMPVKTRICIRVSHSSARLPFHSDPKPNTLFQVHGTRKILLAMPDMINGLYPKLIKRNTEGDVLDKSVPMGQNSAYMASVDPRNANYTTFPLAKDLYVLAVTLHPGDCMSPAVLNSAQPNNTF